MGQSEAYAFLKQHKDGKYTTLEISKALHCSRASATNALRKLLKIGWVDCCSVSKYRNVSYFDHNGLLYWYKE